MKTFHVLAVDLGASSGRGILYTYTRGQLRERVMHRFPNGAEEVNGHLVWNAERIYGEICRAIRLADEACGKLDGVGIDTWGVDFGLIGQDGRLLEAPRHYRDPANVRMRSRYADRDRQFFDLAGISVNDFNTTYQLLARREEAFDWTKVRHLLFMPQLFGYLLTGIAAAEPTIASTSGFYTKDGFHCGFLREAGVPERVFPEVRAPFGTLGVLNERSRELAGIGYDLPVILTPGHDTACAVACCRGERPLYLCSGTWSLFGTLEEAPVLTREAFAGGYTNERSADGRVCFLRNIMGMWLIQECRREWAEAGIRLGYEEIVRLAEGARDTGARIDVNDGAFFSPGNMTDKICGYVREKQGISLRSPGEIARCVYASMAAAYRDAFEELKAITGRNYSRLQILGGGANNDFLNGMIGQTLGVSVQKGPAEASALGNALGQLVGLGAGDAAQLKEALPL